VGRYREAGCAENAEGDQRTVRSPGGSGVTDRKGAEDKEYRAPMLDAVGNGRGAEPEQQGPSGERYCTTRVWQVQGP